MKPSTLILMAALTLPILSVGAGQEKNNDQSPALAKAREAIDRGNAQWIDAWDKADASLIASLFAPDGIMLGRSGKSFKGRSEVLEHMKPVLEGAGKGVKTTVTTVDLWLDGEIAYETGKYSYTFQEKGQPTTDAGRYVTIWKRQPDGSWKIIMDMGVPKD